MKATAINTTTPATAPTSVAQYRPKSQNDFRSIPSLRTSLKTETASDQFGPNPPIHVGLDQAIKDPSKRLTPGQHHLQILKKTQLRPDFDGVLSPEQLSRVSADVDIYLLSNL